MRQSFAIRLSVVTAVFLLTAGTARAATVLELRWDRTSGDSTAVVRVSGGVVIAEYPWDGPLPSAYDSQDEDIEIPTLIVAALRDLLEQSSDPEAAAALSFIEELLGAHATTPLPQVPSSLRTQVHYADYQIGEWCGTAIGPAGECEGQAGGGGPFCVSAACKGTTIQPIP
jgi:hypothetical protein